METGYKLVYDTDNHLNIFFKWKDEYGL